MSFLLVLLFLFLFLFFVGRATWLPSFLAGVSRRMRAAWRQVILGVLSLFHCDLVVSKQQKSKVVVHF